MAKLTIKEIARKAGVSIGTVDRVLHHRGHVAPEKEQRIREICVAENYEQNVVGKAMAMQRKSPNIAVVVNGPERSFFSSRVLDGFHAYQQQIQDYNVNFRYYETMRDTEEEMLSMLDQVEQEPIDGLIIKPYDSPMVSYRLNRIMQKKIPVIFCTSDIAGVNRLCYVGQNHLQDGRMMASLLLKVQNGPLNIIILTASLGIVARRVRINGFLSYLDEHGAAYNVCCMQELSYQPEEAKAEMLHLFQKYPNANALYLNPPDIETCMQAVQEYGKFHGKVFCFGYQERVAKFLKSGQLDFSIVENPFRHGYLSAEIMFHYLLNPNRVSPEKAVIHSRILIDENSDDTEE